MLRTLALMCLLASQFPAGAAQLQGYLADWTCVKQIVKKGEAQTLQKRKNCSLQRDYKRSAYGLITDDKKFYRLDDAGNKHALELLPKSPTRDNLKIIVTGEISGDLIKVSEMSIL